MARQLITLLLLVAATVGVWRWQHRNADTAPSPTPRVSESATSVRETASASPTATSASASSSRPAVVPTRRPRATATPTPLPGIAYQDALKTYGNFRFQFSSCHATPGVMTVKAGQSILLDNRDNAKHTIDIGGTARVLGPYGFAIVAIKKSAGTHYITCDGGGAASILVQP